MNLWLIGMMGSGKTTVGRLVAERGRVPFHDVDLIVQQRLGTTIRDLWERKGEDAFRATESTIVAELAGGDERGVLPPSRDGARGVIVIVIVIVM